jgi:hypothetical protein
MSGDDGLNPNTKVYGLELRLDTATHGINEAFPPNAKEVYLQGVPYNQSALRAEAADVVAPWKAVRAAKAVIRAFARAKPRHVARARTFLGNLQASMVSQYGATNETLTKFGFKPKKKREPLSSEKQIIRVAKGKKTREMRGTKGKAQKAAIKFVGDPTVLITPDAVAHVTDGSVPGAAPPTPPSPPV